MRKSLLLASFIFTYSILSGQNLRLLWTGGGVSGNWNDSTNWLQTNAPAGQTPLRKVPTEFDDVIFSSSQSGLATVHLAFTGYDSLVVGKSTTNGNRCRSMRVSNTNLHMTDDGHNLGTAMIISVYTTNGGRLLIDSSSNVPYGHIYLNGGNGAIKDLEIINSSFGVLNAHNTDRCNLILHPNGKARFINSQLKTLLLGSLSLGGELYADGCDIFTGTFQMGSNSNVTLLNTEVHNDINFNHLNFHIGRNSIFNSLNANVTSFKSLDLYTSGTVLNGNVTSLSETTSSSFSQQDPANPLPNIVNGNLVFLGGVGNFGLKGDVKISGNFLNHAVPELIHPDTSHVFVNGQPIFKIGGIMNYRSNVFISNCAQYFCHFKFELFGSGNSTIKWPVGIPLDTMIINKSGCGKVLVDNSLYVSGQLNVQSGQLVLNPNDGIPYKMVSAGNVIVNSGAGIFLRRNAAGVPASIAIGGTLINNNATSDSTCFGISNPYNGSILSYNPNVNNITVPVCVNSGTSIVSNVSGNTYRWELNTGTGYTLITNGPNFLGATTNTLQLLNIPSSWDNYLIRCIVNGNTPSHTFVLDVVSSIPASVSITSSSTTYCPYSPITFYAHTITGGPNPVYQWQINGLNVAGPNAPMFTPNNLSNNDQVRLVMQSSLVCASPTLTTSNVIPVTTPFVTPSVSITSSATTVCSGSAITFTPLPTNGGATPFYQWLVNGIPAASGPSFTIPSLTSTSVIKVIMTSSHSCAVPLTATSNEVTVTVSSSNMTPSVSIAASATTICSNTSVVFTATPVNGGAQPSYQWQVNGVNAGGNSPTFTSSALTNGSTVWVVMTSSSPCAVPATATSNSVFVNVSPLLVASVSITASAVNICTTASVTFSAAATNAGLNPVYQWKKNGTNVGTNSPVFATQDLVNADVITVSLTSNAACVSATPVISNAITMNVNAGVVPNITISGILLVDQGGSTTITSSVTNGGTAPTYQWQDSTEIHTWQNITSQTNSTLNYSPASTGDKIRAIMTSSATCANPAIAISNELSFTVARPISGDRVATFPNPATSYLIVDSLNLTDQWNSLTVMSQGGKIYFTQTVTGQNRITIPVLSLLPGMYLIRLSRNAGHPLYKTFIKM